MTRLFLIALLLLSSVLPVSGLVLAEDPHYYTCTIVSANMLTDKGTLASEWQQFIGKQFTVDRITGRTLGGPLDNYQLDIQVIDIGSKEMSFQVIAYSTQLSHTTHLWIEEFQPRDNKPFVGITTLYYPGVYSGICR